LGATIFLPPSSIHLSPNAAKCRALYRWLLDTRGARGGTALLLDLLRWSGTFEEWADSAAETGALADSAELRAPDETRRLSEHDVSSLAAMHERDTGVRVTVADDTGFLSSEELAHALARSAAARLELRHRLRQAADAVHGRGSC
jgi:hypothetical protein